MCKRITRHWDVFADGSKMKCCSCGEYHTEEEKSDWQKEIEDWNKSLLKNERNNGREDVFSEIETVFSPMGSFKGRLYFDNADDLIRELKLRLQLRDSK
jgi:hypothetical protein